MPLEAYLCGVSYQLGEARHPHAQASGFQEVLKSKNLPDLPELWGWGDFHVTDDPYRLGGKAAARTLRASDLPSHQVTSTIFACSYFPDNDDVLYQRTGQLLQELELTQSSIEGQTLAGCATLLSAVQDAALRVRTGVADNVLVIGIDKLPRGAARFWDYGLFSDAAASCVVSSTPRGDCVRIVDSARGFDLQEVIGGVRFNAKTSLTGKILDGLLNKTGMKLQDVTKVFDNNVYLPIKSQKSASLGFKKAQLELGNVCRTGHCLACDSLINLADFIGSRPARTERYLLQADGNGCCALTVVERAATDASN
jgi:3-oxoacyl-[acyl-carrier-protein] synthase III